MPAPTTPKSLAITNTTTPPTKTLTNLLLRAVGGRGVEPRPLKFVGHVLLRDNVVGEVVRIFVVDPVAHLFSELCGRVAQMGGHGESSCTSDRVQRYIDGSIRCV